MIAVVYFLKNFDNSGHCIIAKYLCGEEETYTAAVILGKRGKIEKRIAEAIAIGTAEFLEKYSE